MTNWCGLAIEAAKEIGDARLSSVLMCNGKTGGMLTKICWQKQLIVVTNEINHP
jgi:hypothetical protein